MRMIYHVPFPLDRGAASASGIRPVRMLEAFQSLGLDVTLVSGHSTERRGAIKGVLGELGAGKRFDFVYSESSTMPTAMTDPNHLPLHPFMDFHLFRAVRAKGGRVGLFYRDIHWMFPVYKSAVPLSKRLAAVTNYRWDLHNYRSALDVMYLPSAEMGRFLGDVPYRLKPLPPGHNVPDADSPSSAPLRLFYVGGLGVNYELHALVDALRKVPEARLTLCTREAEWATEGPGYGVLPRNVEVVHAVGAAALAPYFAVSNIGVLSTAPTDYFAFAVPFKLFEYIGHGLPILATKGTLTGEIVAENGYGWALEYDSEAMAQQLRILVSQPDQVSKARSNALRARETNTWSHRARQVVEDLTGRAGE